ncbi:hypothetical protein BD779DRAFT_349309 [Infundibulicybe gibba]|nr:hypothetical protein BD779DRAFT_349309 [Infundibulicybe gibba]
MENRIVTVPTEAFAYPSPLVRGAVFRLPLEVLGEIFLHCLPPGKWGSFSARHAPWLLTKVCRSWREVALSTSLLWSKLPFLFERESWKEYGRLQLLKLHLEYSAGTALSLGFDLTVDPDDAPFHPLIVPHLSRSRHLDIRYQHEQPSQDYFTHKHFPLLKSLELYCSPPYWKPQTQSLMAGLGSIKLPWAQLTQLAIAVFSSAEALALLRDCSSLEVCCLTRRNHSSAETLPMPSAPKTVHSRLRALTVRDGPFSAGLLGRLVTPALSSLELIQSIPAMAPRGTPGDTRDFFRLVLLFIRNSPMKLTSLTLRHVDCSPQELADLSALIPTAVELELEGFGGIRLLTIKSGSRYGVLFPRLKRLVIRHPCASESALLDMFYSRLYLAPNVNIIENTSMLQHAELHSPSADARTYFGELSQGKPELRGLISQLRRIYSDTVVLGKEISGQAAEVIHRVNQDGFPSQYELGYCKGAVAKQSYSHDTARFLPLPLLEQCFFQKLDAAFAALEGYRYRLTHAARIVKNGADTLMHEFSRVPETSFLHHPTYKFHVRAAHLLKRWQPMISDYEAKDKWIYKHESTMNTSKLVYHRATRL